MGSTWAGRGGWGRTCARVREGHVTIRWWRVAAGVKARLGAGVGRGESRATGLLLFRCPLSPTNLKKFLKITIKDLVNDPWEKSMRPYSIQSATILH